MNQNKKIIAFVIGILILVGVVVFVTFKYGAPPASVESGLKPGQGVADQGRAHIKLGESHPAYDSLPPTSGWHYADTAKWGIHEEPIEDELQIHNLEHGGIIIQYQPGIDQKTLEELKNIVSGYKTKVILAPYPKLDKKIALTAWTRIDKFEEFDEQRITNFIKAFINKGPEYIPG